jgi:hypothetical protein
LRTHLGHPLTGSESHRRIAATAIHAVVDMYTHGKGDYIPDEAGKDISFQSWGTKQLENWN